MTRCSLSALLGLDMTTSQSFLWPLVRALARLGNSGEPVAPWANVGDTRPSFRSRLDHKTRANPIRFFARKLLVALDYDVAVRRVQFHQERLAPGLLGGDQS